MTYFLKLIYRLDVSLQVVAGLGLAFMMGVTVVDVVLRAVGKPIVGSVELICFSGAVVVGFAIPYASWTKAHVYVDMVQNKLQPPAQKALYIITRCIGVVLFLFVAYNFILYGISLRETGEVTPGLKIPYYPLTYGLAFSCFMESVTLLCDLIRLYRRDTHE